MNKIKFILLLILANATTAGIAHWKIQPASEVRQEKANTEESWQLANIPKNEAEDAFFKLKKSNPWSKREKSTATDAQGNRIRTNDKISVLSRPLKEKLVGIVQQGKNHYILLLDEQNKINQYSLKKELPNGAILMGIYHDKIQITQEDKTETVWLYE